jgi:hypothetical protein
MGRKFQRFIEQAHEISRLEALERGFSNEDIAALLASGDWCISSTDDYLKRTKTGLRKWWADRKD